MRMQDNLYQRILHILTLIVLIGIWVSLIMCWKNLPTQLPKHYNAAGQIDAWGGKGEALLCPVIGTLTVLLLFGVEQVPQCWNTGVKLTPLNQAFVLRTCKSMLVTMELTLLASFGIIGGYTMAALPMPWWMLVVVLALILGPVVFFLIRLFTGSRKYRIGA